MADHMIMLTASAAQAIRSGNGWGHLTLKVSGPELLAGVSAVSSGNGPKMATEPAPLGHFVRSGDDIATGHWYRVPAFVNLQWLFARAQDGMIELAVFRGLIPNGFRSPGGGAYLAITHALDAEAEFPEMTVPEFALWRLTAEGALPLPISVQPTRTGMPALEPHWPVAELAETTMLVVGTGSIGGAVAHALAGYGIGRLHLLDPDRLQWHNLPRHVCGERHVGRFKVNALRDDLAELRPDTTVEQHVLNVVTDADKVRDLLTEVDLVLCAADGVPPRQVVSHLARRAGKTAVLACVLETGGLGEIIRLRPWADVGCLGCQREALFNAGGLRPEPTLDAEYGIGTTHRPMTAVGADLHLVGQLAAKVAVATLLERQGHHDQVLGGEHGVIALRPQPGWLPPYDVNRLGAVTWHPAGPPSPGCPTCEAP
ncbi:HesA/MoeB/ThiF family protein [Kutzneria sp. NPDC052558]|uniref:HesA/MoeB/ThiF family protein n=1 Tax=Kutzneria sp. NPDC052558 TaxID=3364121 RepID=UPI0037CB1E56